MSADIFWMPFLAEVPFGIWLLVAILSSFAFGGWLVIFGWPKVVDVHGNERLAEWPPWVAVLGITFWPIPVAVAVLTLGCVVITSPGWAPFALLFGIKALVKRRQTKAKREDTAASLAVDREDVPTTGSSSVRQEQ